ncbi:MAG: hypothetical protein AAFZ74_03335 [Pseudomonadota bacterium]
MGKLSLPAIVLFLMGAFGAMFLKDLFFTFDGTMEYAASAGAGAVGGIIGAVTGMIIFPKPGDLDD